MSNTVLNFSDFFWIWFIVVFMGGATYLRQDSQMKGAMDALEKEIAALTEEIRSLRGDDHRTS